MDEGRVALNDPIARYAPEFSQMRVLRSPGGPLDETDPAERLITFEDLLTHRALRMEVFIAGRSRRRTARRSAAILTATLCSTTE